MDAPLSRLTGSTNAAAFWAVCRYDAVGNLTNIVYSGNHAMRLAYDDENQLVSVYVTNVWESDFVYDGKMRLRERFESVWAGGTRVTNAVTFYVYDGNLAVQERNGGNLPVVTYTRGRDLSGTFQGAGGVGGLLARTDNSVLATQPSAAHAYYHADGNGNITCLINSQQSVVARYLYDPFGNTLSQSGPLGAANLYRFSSKEFHVNSGLVYYLYRFYDPNLQRWPNRDPIEEWDGIDLYEFANNRPTSIVDRNGRDWWPPSKWPISKPKPPKPPKRPKAKCQPAFDQNDVLNCYGKCDDFCGGPGIPSPSECLKNCYSRCNLDPFKPPSPLPPPPELPPTGPPEGFWDSLHEICKAARECWEATHEKPGD